QRELAKHQELVRAGHPVGLSTLKRLRGRYEREGLWGVIDHRAARQHSPVGWADPRGVEATRRAIAEETDRSTGTAGRLRRGVARLLAEAAAETGEAAPPALRAVLEAGQVRQAEVIRRLELRVAELEHHLRMDSGNSSTPPSKEPLGAKA